jgi:hypothetical protein
MAKYEVIITETLEHTVTVEADSLKEAKEKGYEVVMNGPETDFDTESLGTQLISAEREDGEDEDGEDEDGEDEDGEDEDGADPRRCR